MTTIPFWIDSAPIKQFPGLQKNINVDVLVVGAGITGITTAYLLKKAALTVALIERERVASIDTGHTTAHLTFVTDVGLHELVGNFGDDHAQAAWDAGTAAIDEIERIVQEEEIQCEFTRAPGYLHVCADGFSDKEISSLKKEARVGAKLGLGAIYLERVPYLTVPGVRFPNQAKFHPRKYLRALLMNLSGNGSHVFEKSAVTEFDAEKRRAKVNDHWIGFDRLLGRLKKIIPDAQVNHRWAGQIISTPDGLPYIGENAEHQFIATGFCGNGITFGTISAMMALDWATGRKNPWADLFAVDRKKIKGATWNYLRENKDYPYYLIKDRIARPESDSVRKLKPGEGMIIGSRAKKTAAFRDRNGKLHKLSPVCPHLGCHVRWNTAESTWDCPCHGSRFKPNGDVIAGPAEEALSAG